MIMNTQDVDALRSSVESVATPFMARMIALAKVSTSAQAVNNITQRIIMLESMPNVEAWRLNIENEFLNKEVQVLMAAVEALNSKGAQNDI